MAYFFPLIQHFTTDSTLYVFSRVNFNQLALGITGGIPQFKTLIV